MKEIKEIVFKSNTYFSKEIGAIKERGFCKETYVRYLQMQYHLTKGVQKPFLFLASHERSYPYKKLRQFLVRFAYEEEMHFKLAQNDLKKLGADVGEAPLDVRLWWAFYNDVVKQQPFIRLGATCILENIGNGTSGVVKDLVQSACYLTHSNTTFLRVHLHEALPHGDQILDALRQETFEPVDYEELVRGAKIGFILYARMLGWAIKGEPIL